ncbi:MAG: flagellar hook-associated protein FlgL [Bacillales bacterium]|nr:flagellar hook-associated protein FlgL [Bacillales bacterium]
MRVTQGMLSNRSILNLSRSYKNLGKYQEQLETGKKISKPSDDPVVAMKGVMYRTDLTEIEQYRRNAGEASTWLETTDSAYGHATSILQRARELAVQLSNGTYSGEDKIAAEKEIEQLKMDLVSVANTQVAGRYIFNGTDILDKPVVTDPVTGNVSSVSNNTASFDIEVARGVNLKVNSNPSTFFNAELFSDFEDLSAALKGGSTNIDSFIGAIDKNLDNLNLERSESGARHNRLELIETRNSEQEIIANRILGDNEGADIERVIMNLKVQESVHQAALSVGARIMQQSLMDFLR